MPHASNNNRQPAISSHCVWTMRCWHAQVLVLLSSRQQHQAAGALLQAGALPGGQLPGQQQLPGEAWAQQLQLLRLELAALSQRVDALRSNSTLHVVPPGGG